MERRLQEGFNNLVRNQLGLEPQQASNFGEVVLRFQDERQRLVTREAELRRRYQIGGVVSEGAPNILRRGGPLMADAEAREVLREMRALRTAETDLFSREQDRLLELVSPGQLVRYYLLREQLAESIGRLRGGAPGGGGLGRQGDPQRPPPLLRPPGGG
jgi:hypothetical protein